MSKFVLVLCLGFIATGGLLAQTPPASPKAQPTSAPDVKKTMRELWRESVAAPEPSTMPSALADAIKELQQIEVVRRKPEVQTPRTDPMAVKTPAHVPSSMPALPAQTLAGLKALSPQDVADPASIGDMFFNAGQLAAAEVLYELAIKKGDAADKAWLVFQLANCKSQNDLAAAAAVYDRVSREFPNSTWAPVAAGKAKLMLWLQDADVQAALGGMAATGAATSQPATAPAAVASK